MVVVFTGFPGFLGSALLPRVLRRTPSARAVCLVQSRFASLARARAAALMGADTTLRGRLEVVEGDIREPGLGASPNTLHDPVVEEVYHLAAAYDLAVPRELALRVNVDGTRHVLEFSAGCRALRRLHYVSTCYVSGKLRGVFFEHELERGQAFHNWYEETKYLAELEVRAAMATGIPGTIYRPAVVVGDSRSGETQKFDGPYFVIQLVRRQPRIALVPVTGDVARTTFNIVPSDFVVEAIAWLSAQDRSRGVTYHLADPDPPTIRALLTAIGRATGRRVLTVRVPLRLARAVVAHVPGVRHALRVPPETLDYFAHPATYDTTNAVRDLGGSGIAVPRFESYVRELVEFMRHHDEIGTAAMV